jgi:uncharacterized tellurite resistance protein B-like protein
MSVHLFDEPKLEALVELLWLSATADGEFSESERAHFTRKVLAMTGERFTGASLDALVARIEADGARQRDRAAWLAALRDELGNDAAREAALRMVVEMVLADQVFRTSERELVLELADALGIDHDTVADFIAESGG